MKSRTLSKTEWKKIQRKRFFFWALGLFSFAAVALIIATSTPDQGIPKPLRQVHEWNGALWQKVFSPIRQGENPQVPPGKEPRVNGLVGLEEDVDTEAWTLEVITDRDTPGAKVIQLKLDDLLKMPQSHAAALFKCVEGWSEDVTYGGVKFSDFMKELDLGHLPGSQELYPYVGFETPDRKYYVSIDMDSMLHEKTLLATSMNGTELSADNGAPLRLVIPLKYGIKNIKRIGRIFFSRERPRDYWTERGYDWYSGL